MEIERRRFPRYPFVATIRIEEILSQNEVVARTTNISLGGCFIEDRTPLARGVPVRITISHEGMTFRALGNVVLALENVGMRLAFETFSPDNQAVLETWIAVAKQRSMSSSSS